LPKTDKENGTFTYFEEQYAIFETPINRSIIIFALFINICIVLQIKER